MLAAPHVKENTLDFSTLFHAAELFVWLLVLGLLVFQGRPFARILFSEAFKESGRQIGVSRGSFSGILLFPISIRTRFRPRGMQLGEVFLPLQNEGFVGLLHLVALFPLAFYRVSGALYPSLREAGVFDGPLADDSRFILIPIFTKPRVDVFAD